MKEKAGARRYWEIVNRAGQPLEIHTSEGAIARYLRSVSKIINVDAPLEIKENNCGSQADTEGRTGDLCILRIPNMTITEGWVWTSHPDSSRIGKPVLIRIDSSKDAETVAPKPRETVFAYFSFAQAASKNRKRYSKRLETLPRHELICDRYDWIPDNPTINAPEKLRIPLMYSQRMVNNSETFVNENKLQLSFKKISFTRGHHGTLLADDYPNKTNDASPDRDVFPFDSDILAWSFPERKLGACEIAINFDLASATSVFIEDGSTDIASDSTALTAADSSDYFEENAVPLLKKFEAPKITRYENGTASYESSSLYFVSSSFAQETVNGLTVYNTIYEYAQRRLY